MRPATVVSFGEILWDLLPSGKSPGGAPMNVAYHLQTLGLPTGMVSRIGNDPLGDELKALLESKKIDLQLLQTDPTLPTGTVKVTLDSKGSPSYEIVHPVAWDHIENTEEASKAVQEAKAFVYGSLASRTQQSRQTLLALLQEASLKIFDVNLRVPFFDKKMIEPLLRAANIVKMNDEELVILSEWYGGGTEEQQQVPFLRDLFQLEAIILTKGADGAALLNADGWFDQPVVPVQVQDTIGSGDAFLAGFLFQYIQQQPVQKCLAFAAKMGAYVATQKGAMPAYRPLDLF